MKTLGCLLYLAALLGTGFCCGTTGTGAVTEPPPPPETEAPATETPAPNCGCQVACDFSKDSCSYKQSGGEQQWKLSSTRSGNRDTGVAGPDQGSTQFFDTRPGPHKTSSITSADLNCPSPVNVLVRFWEDTNQMSLREGSSDQSVSRFGIDASDRQWNSKIIKIPGNTKNLNFICDNQGPNIGNCGINKITIVDDAGNDQCGAGGAAAPAGGGTAAPASGEGTEGGSDGGSAEQDAETEQDQEQEQRKRRARLHKRRRQRQRLRN